MTRCTLCPHKCQVDRTVAQGVCRLDNNFWVALTRRHFDEEPCLSGTGGSGTIFFSGCNARCIFCQNHKISGGMVGQRVSGKELIDLALALKKDGAHNINLVSPTPYSHLLVEWLPRLRAAVQLPIIWNSNGYERVETLQQLAGLVDIYLPDFKYAEEALAVRYSSLPRYFEYATAALQEMWRQVGPNQYHDHLLQRGLIVRHLVLPGQTADSKKILDWIYIYLGPQTVVSLMAQYYPTHLAASYPELNRKLSPTEYTEIADYFDQLGFQDGYLQELSAADEAYTPDFS